MYDCFSLVGGDPNVDRPPEDPPVGGCRRSRVFLLNHSGRSFAGDLGAGTWGTVSRSTLFDVEVFWPYFCTDGLSGEISSQKRAGGETVGRLETPYGYRRCIHPRGHRSQSDLTSMGSLTKSPNRWPHSLEKCPRLSDQFQSYRTSRRQSGT